MTAGRPRTPLDILRAVVHDGSGVARLGPREAVLLEKLLRSRDDWSAGSLAVAVASLLATDRDQWATIHGHVLDLFGVRSPDTSESPPDYRDIPVVLEMVAAPEAEPDPDADADLRGEPTRAATAGTRRDVRPKPSRPTEPRRRIPGVVWAGLIVVFLLGAVRLFQTPTPATPPPPDAGPPRRPAT